MAETKQKDYENLQKYIAYVFDFSEKGKQANQSLLLKTIRNMVMSELEGSAPYGIHPNSKEVERCIIDAKNGDKKATMNLFGWCTPVIMKYFHLWGGKQALEDAKSPRAFVGLAWETLTAKRTFEQKRQKIDGLKQDLTTFEELDAIPVQDIINLDVETVNTKMGALQYFNFDKVSEGRYLATFAYIYGRFLISSTIKDNGLKYQIRQGVDEDGNSIEKRELVAKLKTVRSDVDSDEDESKTLDLLDVSAYNEYEQTGGETAVTNELSEFEDNLKKFKYRKGFIRLILDIREIKDPYKNLSETEQMSKIQDVIVEFKDKVDKKSPGLFEKFVNNSVFTFPLIIEAAEDINGKYDEIFKKYAPEFYEETVGEEIEEEPQKNALDDLADSFNLLEESLRKSKMLREMSKPLGITKGKYKDKEIILHKQGLLNTEGFLYYFELALQYSMHSEAKGNLWTPIDVGNGVFYFPNLSAADVLSLVLKLLATGKVKFPDIIFRHRIMNSGGKGGKKPLKEAYMADYDLRIISNYFVYLGYDPYTVAPRVGETLKKILDTIVIGYTGREDIDHLNQERINLCRKAIAKWKGRWASKKQNCTNYNKDITRELLKLPPINLCIEGKEEVPEASTFSPEELEVRNKQRDKVNLMISNTIKIVVKQDDPSDEELL